MRIAFSRGDARERTGHHQCAHGRQGTDAALEGARSTLVYTRNDAGQQLPSMVVFGGRVKLPNNFQRVDWLAEAPLQSEGEGDADVPPNVVDAEGVLPKAHWTEKRASLNTEPLIQ